MSNTRNLADLLDTSGDIKSAALDNVTPTTSASDLTSGTLAGARIADDTITTAKVADGQITAAKVAADVATQAEIDAKLNLTGGTLTGTLTMESTDAGSAAAPELILYRNSASPADGDYLGQVQFKGENDNGGSEIYAKVTGKITDASNGTEDGLIETAIKGNGSFTIVSRQKSDELQLLNGVNLDVAGNIVVGGTVDGVDIQTLNTTAGAALPKAGGTMTNNLTLADSVRLNVGTSADLKIYHDGSHSYIEDSGTGNLKLRSNKFYIDNADSSKDMAIFNDGGSCDFYHNNSRKLETTSAGITAQGRLEIQTANDANTHLVQRMGSTAGSYGYVDLELVSPNSTAAGLPRLDLQIGNSTVASFLRGGGITFNGDTAAVNALDDYEEGTWTPTLGPGSGQSYASQVGTYTKVGNVVHCWVDLSLSARGSITGTARILGLPFTPVSSPGIKPGSFICQYMNLPSGHKFTAGVYAANSFLYIWEEDVPPNGGVSQPGGESKFTNNSAMWGSFSYIAS